MARYRKTWIIAAIGACITLSSTAQAAGLSIRTIAANELRLSAIGYRIATANASSCSAPQMMSGMIVHDLTQYPLSARGAVSRAFSLDRGIGVLGVVPGSGAARAGLKVDDEILRFGDRSVESATAWTQRAASYHRIDDFFLSLSQALGQGPQRLIVRRNGRLVALDLAGRQGCGGDIKFVDSSSVNAWSDGRHVVLSAAIVNMARSDDELAFVIAHEMAHNILGHLDKSGRDSRALLGQLFAAGGPRGAESQADAAAVSLMNKGGYAPEAGISFLQAAGRRMWWAVSLSHPGFGSRMRTVAAAIARDRLHAFPMQRRVAAVPGLIDKVALDHAASARPS